MFDDEIATHTSIATGNHSQYFSLNDKKRQLDPGNLDAII